MGILLQTILGGSEEGFGIGMSVYVSRWGLAEA